jgi:hypothetical protein
MKLPTIQPDALDLEQLRDTIASEGYALLLKRIQATIADQMKSLLTVESWDNVRYRQGFAAGLQCALDIPATIAAEIKARAKK